jgi:hypothetical protein
VQDLDLQVQYIQSKQDVMCLWIKTTFKRSVEHGLSSYIFRLDEQVIECKTLIFMIKGECNFILLS